jgi:hypothetical protein
MCETRIRFRFVIRSLVVALVIAGIPLSVLLAAAASGPNDFNFSQCVSQANCGNCLDGYTTSPACAPGFACALFQGSTVQARQQTCVDSGSSNQWCQGSGTGARCNNMNVWFCTNCRDPKTGNCLNMATTCLCSGTPSGTGYWYNMLASCTGGS